LIVGGVLTRLSDDDFVFFSFSSYILKVFGNKSRLVLEPKQAEYVYNDNSLRPTLERWSFENIRGEVSRIFWEGKENFNFFCKRCEISFLALFLEIFKFFVSDFTQKIHITTLYFYLGHSFTWSKLFTHRTKTLVLILERFLWLTWFERFFFLCHAPLPLA
jgi:hypothetical protein